MSRRVKILSISQNPRDCPNLQPCTVYASLTDVDSGELLVISTLAYIADAIQKHKHVLVSVEPFSQETSTKAGRIQ